jgi:fumarylacetoacetate (FAA) hydrolase
MSACHSSLTIRLAAHSEALSVKLASLRSGGRDGRLVVVSRDLSRAVPVDGIATLQAALDDWGHHERTLSQISRALDADRAPGAAAFEPGKCAAPLPRAYQWCDGSAYLSHAELVRRARNAEMPASLYSDPLIYQGGSDILLGPRDDIPLIDDSWGLDLEAEIAVIVDDVPMGIAAGDAPDYIRLVLLVNDLSLRNLIPQELAKQFGFFQSKPPTAFSPVAVTVDELGPAWDGRKLSLPVISQVNGRELGRPNAGIDLNFDFGELMAHAAKTRPLGAGTIIGSGTVSNRDPMVGSSCLQERRVIEIIEGGKPQTPFLTFGDTVKIEVTGGDGRSLFGSIEQRVVRFVPHDIPRRERADA